MRHTPVFPSIYMIDRFPPPKHYLLSVINALKITTEHLRSCLAHLNSRAKSWVCGRSLAGIEGSNPAGVWMSLSLVSGVCCQVKSICDGLVTRTQPSVMCLWSWSLDSGRHAKKKSCSKQGRVDEVKQVQQKHGIRMEKSNKFVGQRLGQPLVQSRCRWLHELMKMNNRRGWRLDSSTSEWKSVVSCCARTFEFCSWWWMSWLADLPWTHWRTTLHHRLKNKFFKIFSIRL